MSGTRGLFNKVWSLTRTGLVIALFWIWFRHQEEKDKGSIEPIELKSEEPPQPPSAEQPESSPITAPPKASAASKQDDLTRIKGIGPKTANVFQQAGITTFRQLAETDIQKITEILEEANYRLLDPSTWNEQARLAGEEKWEELAQLQETK